MTVKLKIFFQKVCKTKLEWDNVLNSDLLNEWTHILNWLQTLDKIIINRCYCLTDIADPTVKVQLIGFSDASLQAYDCVIYLKFIKKSGDIKITFVTAKLRVSPMKLPLSICRFELFGNLILSRMVKAVTNTFKDYLKIHEELKNKP